MPRTFFLLLAASLALVHAADAPARTLRCSQCGTVIDVDPIRYDRDVGAEGAIVGAIVGAAIGSQVGSGSGRRAATVAGAVAGGLVGRNADRHQRRGGEIGRRLELRMDRGGYRVIEVHGPMRIYRGDRVRVLPDRIVPLD